MPRIPEEPVWLLALSLLACEMVPPEPSPNTPPEAAQAPPTAVPAPPRGAGEAAGGAPAPSSKLTLGSQGQPPRSPQGFDGVIRPEQCDDTSLSGAPKDGCITGTIRCGTTVIGHTSGGADRFDGAFYERNYCTPDGTERGDGERIYHLEMPEGAHRALIDLETPCADLDLVAIEWNDPGCPTIKNSIRRCEMAPKRSTRPESLELSSPRKSSWLIVVEGKGDEEGAFALTVECPPGLF